MIDLVIISGPTGVGKTKLSEMVAESEDCDIISGDSQAVYTGLDIGTAKPDIKNKIRYHLVDIKDPSENYNVSLFVSDAEKALQSIYSGGRHAIMSGGSPMYIDRFLFGLADCPAGDPEIRKRLQSSDEYSAEGGLYKKLREVDPKYADKIHPNDKKRIIRALEVFELSGKPFSEYEETDKKPRYQVLHYILNMDRVQLYKRIEKRVDKMIEEGWIDEIRELLGAGLAPDSPGLASLGYRELTAYLNNKAGLEDSISLIKKHTRHFARRQLIWLRKVKNAVWLDAGRLSNDEMSVIVTEAVKQKGGMK